MFDRIELVAFRGEHQPAARALILAGLGERWGETDESLVPDIDDIGGHHAEGYFVVAEYDGEVIGTGGLLSVSDDEAHVHRMSVAKKMRRQGIASSILSHLLKVASDRGFNAVVLETTDTWHDAITFYLSRGFEETGRRNGEVYFRRSL